MVEWRCLFGSPHNHYLIPLFRRFHEEDVGGTSLHRCACSMSRGKCARDWVR